MQSTAGHDFSERYDLRIKPSAVGLEVLISLYRLSVSVSSDVGCE